MCIDVEKVFQVINEGWDTPELVRRLPTVHEALCSIPSTTQNEVINEHKSDYEVLDE